MTWLRIDDGFVEHERIEPLTDKAFRLHVTGMCLCARQLTDGFVSDKNVRVCLLISGATRRNLHQLVAAGLWIPVDSDGANSSTNYTIRDYLDYNPSAEKVRADRAKAAERMRNVRGNVPPHVRANFGRTSGERSPTPSRPVPKDLKPSFLPTPTTDAEGLEGLNIGNILKEVDAV